MENALAVGSRQSRAQLPGHPHRPFLGEAADATEERSQILAVHVLHGEEVVSVHLADVPHAADVRVGNLTRQAHLVEEALPAVCVVAERRRQELERHRLPELHVVCPIDLAHSAAAERRDDPIPIGEDDPG